MANYLARMHRLNTSQATLRVPGMLVSRTTRGIILRPKATTRSTGGSTFGGVWS